MNQMKKIIERMGEFLVDRLGLDQPGKGKPELQQEIVALSMGKKSSVRAYYVKKVSLFLLVLMVGILISLVGFLVSFLNRGEMVTQSIGRPGYGEGDRKEALTVQIEGSDEEELEITVQERKYTDAQKQELLDQALEELDTLILGENETLDEVRSDLYFPETMEDGAVTVSYLTVPYGIIGTDGTLSDGAEDAGTLIEIEATLTCQEQEASYTVYAKVFPPIRTEEEQLRQAIQKEVEEADARDSNEETLTLPQTADGKQLTWLHSAENPLPSLLVLTVLLAFCTYLEMDSRIHQKAEKRKAQLMMDYPDLMWKMTMLLGAGLSIKGTFSRISSEYLREKKEKEKHRQRKDDVRYVYEEVTYTCYEMENGIPEAEAYERFGKRCQLPEYIRLGSVLSQNLRKGAKGLTALLETEAASSMNERKNHARKIGEQAGTKLLLPMVLMLIIVLVILMVPAFLSF
jgi:hypothetical protein